MLDVRLEKLAKIGTRKSITFVVRWLSENATSVETLRRFAQNTGGINASEIEPILWLFQSMGLIRIVNGNDIEVHGLLYEKYKNGKDSFNAWFIAEFIEFALNNDIIDIGTISYNIAENAYVMSATTIKPQKHACYRNILIEYDAITLLPDAKYIVGDILYRAIKPPERHKKITEEQLFARLEAQREQGERGELFVLEFEKQRITDPVKQAMIERVSTIDVSAGFDIVSFNDNSSSRIDRFIEVKTFKGGVHFHWSGNEKETASFMGESYFLYLVNDDCIDKEGYEPLIIQNPVKVIFDSEDWIIESDSYRITKLVTPQ